jgi:hypothetical protein
LADCGGPSPQTQKGPYRFRGGACSSAGSQSIRFSTRPLSAIPRRKPKLMAGGS